MRKKELEPLISIMKFELDNPLEFIPGQFCNIKIEKEGKPLLRPYSIASAPDGNSVEFYIKGYEDGRVAPHILEMGEGDSANITGPFGSFTLRDTDKEIYFICAGSGVAPLIGMARQLHLENSSRKRTFIQGASYETELGYLDELRSMESDFFTYIPTISRPEENPGWDGSTGRVETYLDSCTNTDAEVYVCGPPPMVKSVTEELKKRGFANIFSERYY